jgi:hypothetical protein
MRADPKEPAGIVSVVIDSSITLAWIYSDETTEAVREVFRQVARTGAWVPGLWRLELANVLEMGSGVRGTRQDFAIQVSPT